MKLPAVVVPVFRNSATIIRCLESINEASAGTNCEVRLVFDGVHDDSLDLASDWIRNAGLGWKQVVIKHSGIAGARNAGLESVTSDYVTFLDADDQITCSRMFSQATDVSWWGNQHVVTTKVSKLPAGTRLGVSPYFMSMVIETEFLKKLGGFSVSYKMGDDFDLMIRLKERGIAPVFRDDIYTIRHISPDNASHDIEATKEDYVRAIRSHLRQSRS